MAANFITEIFGLIFTLAFFIVLFESREKLEWKSIGDTVLKRLGREIHGLFVDLANVCKVTRGGGVPPNVTFNEFFRQLFFIQLEELNKKVELNALGKKYFSKGALSTLFKERGEYLSELELKYGKFLDPTLVKSLMEIQDNLYHLSIELGLKKSGSTWFVDEEEFFKLVTLRIHRIVQEIYKIHEMVEIYPRKTKT